MKDWNPARPASSFASRRMWTYRCTLVFRTPVFIRNFSLYKYQQEKPQLHYNYENVELLFSRIKLVNLRIYQRYESCPIRFWYHAQEQQASVWIENSIGTCKKIFLLHHAQALAQPTIKIVWMKGEALFLINVKHIAHKMYMSQTMTFPDRLYTN